MWIAESGWQKIAVSAGEQGGVVAAGLEEQGGVALIFFVLAKNCSRSKY